MRKISIFVLATLLALSFFAAATTASAAQQADWNRWLEEWVIIRSNPKAKAVEEYTKAAEKGSLVAPVFLERLMKSLNNKADEKKWAKVNKDNNIVSHLREQASTDARAQTLLCHIYDEGLAGVAVDVAKAVEWARKASDQGFSLAQNYLGYMYGTGRGVPMDDAKAVELYRKAAEQGLYFAQGNMGYRYQHGNGVPKDMNQAVAWYRKAAAQGHQESINDLRQIEEAGRRTTASGTASGGSTSSGSNQKTTEKKPTCQYCGKFEYGRCVSAPTPGTSTMNKLGCHRVYDGGRSCVWCGSKDRFSNCPFSGDSKHEF